MPNGNVHKTAGAILGPLAYLAIHNNSQQKEKVDLGELLLSSGIGLSTARIPDILEPAIHPNHRTFFHSFVFGVILCFIIVYAWNDLKAKRCERKVMGIQNWSRYEFLDIIIMIGVGSILLHLIMDGYTPRGIPII
ncbi:MAG: metal-dependent hydrolase [Ignavibacterium sp.]|jgi:membrane-bound metal-dependent hydrolase YbcI (DUF457 family)|nr:metal-dependent hydrolase [Ignavibacterium sp.]